MLKALTLFIKRFKISGACKSTLHEAVNEAGAAYGWDLLAMEDFLRENGYIKEIATEGNITFFTAGPKLVDICD